MAAISMFYGLIIYLYQYDNIRHHIPHIHVKYQGEWAVFSILDGTIIEGELKSDKVKLVQAWMLIHNEDLLANWELAKTGQPIFKIEPLK
ncbi:MAG: DUF4160 domain-containing protein [Candidatus Symbiothrix sp.]|jgi:hypothetical protein|nr:DUF4160 domain-containing protein [Candidatus Symbiothrix sp.]